MFVGQYRPNACSRLLEAPVSKDRLRISLCAHCSVQNTDVRNLYAGTIYAEICFFAVLSRWSAVNYEFFLYGLKVMT